MNRITLILLMLSCKVSTWAQIQVKTDDKLIKFEWIKPAHSFYRNQTWDTNGHLMYDFVMENFIKIDSANNQIIFARSRQTPPGSFSIDTSVTDLHFTPIRMHEIHFQQQVSYEMMFDKYKANVKTTRKNTVTEKVYPMKEGYFEDNMTGYILGYINFIKGYSYILDNFNKDTPSPSDPYIIDFAFDDIWKAGADIDVNCTVLHFIHGATSGYIWIDKYSHVMLKKVGNFKTGSYIITKI